jgi:hypothetical protein
MLQYDDNLAVDVSHVDVKNVHWTVQSVCDSFNGFITAIELSISESRYEFVLLSRTQTYPSVCVTLNGQCMPVVLNFRYFVVVFDGKLLWEAHVH